MSPTTNNRRQRRTGHRFYAEIVADITTRNSERKHTTHNTKSKKSNTDPIYTTGGQDEPNIVFMRKS